MIEIGFISALVFYGLIAFAGMIGLLFLCYIIETMMDKIAGKKND